MSCIATRDINKRSLFTNLVIINISKYIMKSSMFLNSFLFCDECLKLIILINNLNFFQVSRNNVVFTLLHFVRLYTEIKAH